MNRILLSILLFGPVILHAQYDHESILPGKTGDELILMLIDQFKPEQVLDFTTAKDVLYGEIYEENDTVTCVYSGHAIYLDPDADPSTWLYQNGSQDGINAEHNYPKSKGASNGNALSDLFNLFPSRTQVNSDRGNLPFGEIPDTETSFWYFLNEKKTGIPAEHINLYSEGTNLLFEPREDHKGNVARSVFYFVTMYQNEVAQADPQFFESMRSTLCDWHFYDPVDSLEWERNARIASFQSGKKNPFILDCSLAGRTYCDFIDALCTATGTDSPNWQTFTNWTLFPNPAYDHFNIRLDQPTNEDIRINVVNTLGKTVFTHKLEKTWGEEGNYLIPFNQALVPGLYMVQLSGPHSHSDSKKLIIN